MSRGQGFWPDTRALLAPPSWKADGNCVVYEGESFIYRREKWDGGTRFVVMTVGPELFFPEQGGSAGPARFVCSSCPVKDRCAEYAITNHEQHGVWGGLSERDRREIRKKRREAA